MRRSRMVALSAVLLLAASACGGHDKPGGAAGNATAASRDSAFPVAAVSTVDDTLHRSPAPADSPLIAAARPSTGTLADAPASARRTQRPGSASRGLSASPAHAARGPRRVLLGSLDLTGLGHDQGSITAPVVIIDFSDFGCPYCGEFTRETYPVLEREYVRTGKVFFKYVPFIVGMFPHAAEATRAVECAAEQGRFWAMADHVYEAQKAWKSGGDPRSLLTGIAGVVGADTTRLSQCYADRRTDTRTARANAAASTVGVRVTPSFVVNERPIQGALPLADFRKVIDAALLVEAAKQ